MFNKMADIITKSEIKHNLGIVVNRVSRLEADLRNS